MSHFYDDDEKDYYHGDTWGGRSMKSIYESSVREKFTLDEEDEDVSPSFGGSYQLKTSTVRVDSQPKRVSVRSAFGGNPKEDSSTSDSDISLADLLGSDSESDVSEEDVKEVKGKFGGSVLKKKLDKYQEMKNNWRYKDEEVHSSEIAKSKDYGGNRDKGNRDKGYSEAHSGNRDKGYSEAHKGNRDKGYGEAHSGNRDKGYSGTHSGNRDKGYGEAHSGNRDKGYSGTHSRAYGGRRDEITDSDEDEVHRDAPVVYGIYDKPKNGTYGGAFTFNFGGGYDSDSDGIEELR